MNNRPPTLLVLAASVYQLDAIRTARRLGYRVVTLDNVPSNPGHALADSSHNVDTTDKDGVLEVARGEGIAGVLAACTDVAVPAAAHVAETLGLPGPPLRSAQILTSKVEFRRFLAGHKISVPRAFPVISSFEPAAELFADRPWILKPDRSSGSKGIYVVRSQSEFNQRLPETLGFSSNGAAVLEEFIAGHQGTCEGIIQEGKIKLSFLLDRQTAPLPYVTTVGHHCPSILARTAQQRLHELIERVFQLLDIHCSVFDCDFVATDNEVYLIEMSPRPGGNSISGLLLRAAQFDFMEYAVRQACGDVARLPTEVSLRPSAVLLLGVWEAGALFYDAAEAEALRGEKWVDTLTIDLPMGALVQPFVNGRHRIGEAFIFGDDHADLDAKASSLRKRLNLRTK